MRPKDPEIKYCFTNGEILFLKRLLRKTEIIAKCHSYLEAKIKRR